MTADAPTSADPPPPPLPVPRRRRRWSPGLRGLMILVLLAGGGIGWESDRVARLRRAVATLERPVIVTMADLGPFGSLVVRPSGTPRRAVDVTVADRLDGVGWLKGPMARRAVGWCERAVGPDHFRRVTGLKFDRRPTAADWDAIAALGTVERLDFMLLGVTDDDLARLGKCSSLRDLDLSCTPITDKALAAVGRLPALRSLAINQTYTTVDGPAALAGAHGLEELTLHDDLDADAALVHLAGLRNLRSLVAGRISDRGLAALRGNARLARLSFQAWNLTDAGWADLTGFAGLEELRIEPGSSNFARVFFGRAEPGRPLALSAGAAGSLARLVALRKLKWRDLGDATWLRALRPLARLRDLDIAGAWVDDDALAAVGDLARLDHLAVRGDRFTDAGLAPLGRLANLEGLRINSPAVTDAGLAHLAGLARLRSLTLDASVGPAAVAALRARLPGLATVRNRRNHRSPPPGP